MDKKTLYLGIFAYMVLAVLSQLFFLERTALTDISFHLFHILKDGEYAIQNYRFGSVFTQTAPLVGCKLGLGLETIMRWYSLVFVLYYAAIFLLAHYLGRGHCFGVAMLLFSTLMVADTFYWIQSEFPQGLAMLLLFFACMSQWDSASFGRRLWHIPSMVFLVFNLAFIHPLIIFPYTFLAAFFYLKGDFDKKILLGGSGAFLMVYLIKSLLFKTGYDSGAMGGVKNFITLFPNYFDLQSNKDFLAHVWQDFYLLFLALGAVALHYARQREFLRLGLMLCFFTGYLALINVSYFFGGEAFYMENLYLPLSLFVIVPLVFDVMPHWEGKWQWRILAAAVVLRLFHMGFSHQPYTQRIAYLEEYLEDNARRGYPKEILHENRFDMDKLMMSWGTPYEFWLLSTLREGKSRSIVIHDHPYKMEGDLHQTDRFVTQWGAYGYSELPRKYFIFDDSRPYEKGY